MHLIESIKREAVQWNGLPFWSWNDKLKKEELIRQIHDMKKKNCGGFFMHARGGLQTAYFSEEWFEHIRTCVDEAQKLQMQAWVYDENGWPSGFAGGKLLVEGNYVSFLTSNIGSFDPEAFAVYDRNGNRIFADNGEQNLLNVYRQYSHDYVDVMNPRVVRQFIDAVYEEYKKQLGEERFDYLSGFFTDEPEYYRYHTPWSDTFQTEFEKEYGYDVFSALPAMFLEFEGAKERRYDYWLLCHKKYIESFPRQIYEWCEKNGVLFTGHTIEETSLAGQMWTCGGAMPFYEYEHIPGIDHLSNQIHSDLCTKQLGSVAAQLGKERALTESFAESGWDVSPNMLKRNLQWQFAAGINTLCHHLYPYSERGERKYDFPAHFGEHLPWSEYLKDFNEYFSRLACAMSKGTENADVLVIHPLRSAYLYFKRDEDDTLGHLEEPLDRLLRQLGDDNVQYHLGDESLIAKYGKIEEDSFCVGKCRYRFVILPKTETIDASTAALLREYIANGGKVFLSDDRPVRIDGRISDTSFLISTTSYSAILASREAYVEKAEIRMNVRSSPYGRMFYAANVTNQIYHDAILHIPHCKGIVELDMQTLLERAVPYETEGDGIKVPLKFGDSKDYFFLEKEAAPCKRKGTVAEEKHITITDFSVEDRPENCCLLDFAALSADGIRFEKQKYVKHIHELLLKRRFKGRIWIKYTFEINFLPQELLFCTEPQKNLQIAVNGNPVAITKGYRIDRGFVLAQVAGFVKQGHNEIVVSFDYSQPDRVYKVVFNNVLESMRNCLAFETEIEPAYLFGDFSVSGTFENGKKNCLVNHGDLVIDKAKEKITLKDMVSGGYPFFFGKVCGKASFQVEKGGRYTLSAVGDFSVCNLYINDRFMKTLLFERCCEVDLPQGNHEIKVELIGTLRNVFGPLHHSDGACDFVYPTLFTFEGEWSEESVPENFREDYSFIPFGLEHIQLEELPD